MKYNKHQLLHHALLQLFHERADRNLVGVPKHVSHDADSVEYAFASDRVPVEKRYEPPTQTEVDAKILEIEGNVQHRYRPVDIVGLVNTEFGINLPMLLTGNATAATKLVNALLSTISLYTETGVNPDDPLFTSGLDGLVQVGVFTKEQRAQIVPLIKKHLTPIR